MRITKEIICKVLKKVYSPFCLIFFFLCCTMKNWFTSIIQLTSFYFLCQICPLGCWFYWHIFHFQKYNVGYFSKCLVNPFNHLLLIYSCMSLHIYICMDICFSQVPSVRHQETLGHFENCFYWPILNVLGKHIEGRDRASSLTWYSWFEMTKKCGSDKKRNKKLRSGVQFEIETVVFIFDAH